MNDSKSTAKASIAADLAADLKALERDHGMSSELIKSLTTSKEEARAHIRFFKRMMFISNSAAMTIGLAILGFGVKRLTEGFSVLGAVSLVVGLFLFLKFAIVFASMTKAINNTEAVAQKYDLI